MLFGGSNPWSGGRMFGAQRPTQQFPTQQFPPNPVAQPGGGSTGAPLSYPQPTWPGATQDGTYSQGLAGYYANQLPNQQVPGSPQMQQPMPPQGVAMPPQMPQQQPQMQQQPDWRNAFHQAMSAWRGGNMFSQGGNMLARPDRSAYRMGSM